MEYGIGCTIACWIIVFDTYDYKLCFSALIFEWPEDSDPHTLRQIKVAKRTEGIRTELNIEVSFPHMHCSMFIYSLLMTLLVVLFEGY